MFALNLKLSNRRLVIVLFAVILISVVLVATRAKSLLYDNDNSTFCNDQAEILEYINSFGLVIGDVSSSSIKVPEVFSDVYNNYNELQKQQGFDLTDYKGKVLTRYVGEVKNYNDSDNVFVEVLTFDGIVVGADIFSTSVDGFIEPLK